MLNIEDSRWVRCGAKMNSAWPFHWRMSGPSGTFGKTSACIKPAGPIYPGNGSAHDLASARGVRQRVYLYIRDGDNGIPDSSAQASAADGASPRSGERAPAFFALAGLSAFCLPGFERQGRNSVDARKLPLVC